VDASSVVSLDERRKCRGPGSVGLEGLSVGPLGLQCPVEAFDFAVLPGAVRTDELLLDASFSTELSERESVCPGVVGDQPLDAGDAVLGEVLDRASRNPAQVGPFSSGRISE